MTTYQREEVADVLEDIQPLLVAHWREIAHYPDIPLDPDYDFYLTHPGVRVYTARKEGMIVGYGIFIVARNKHYKGSIQAVQDILFVDSERRGSTVGHRLLKFIHAQLKAEGAEVVYQHVKLAYDFGPLLRFAGYEPIETIYGRRL